MTLRMRKKPLKPCRKVKGRSVELFWPIESDSYTPSDIEALANRMSNLQKDYSDITFVFSKTQYSDNDYHYTNDPILTAFWQESKSEFAIRNKRYEAQLLKYNQWKQDNATKIIDYNKRKNTRIAKRKMKKIKQLEKEIQQLNNNDA